MKSLHGERVLLRPWIDADLPAFAALNADPLVMRHFARALSQDDSDALATRIRQRIDTLGHGLWALQVPGIPFAGFVGLAPATAFAPAWGELDTLPELPPEPMEIGWRLAAAAWGKGYATEAAHLVLRHAHDVLGWRYVVSITAVANTASEAVMRRIGMKRVGEFDHPSLPEGHRLRRHLLYLHDGAVTPQPLVEEACSS